MHRTPLPLVILLVVAFSSAPLGQSGALLEGTVRDPGGAPVEHVSVRLVDPGTRAARITTTSALGHYRFAGLDPAASYELSAEAEGFAPARLTLSDLAAGQHRTIDLTVELPAFAEQVDVRAEGAPVSASTAALGGLVEQSRIESAPVNGRDLISLAYLLPGAAPARGFYNLAPRLTINGASSLVTNYTIDGFDNTDLFLGGPKVPVPIGATQNLSVLANSYSVEYGRTGNGVFAVTTRNGTNRQQGEAFYQVRPGSLLDSPNHFAPRDEAGGVVEDSFVRHQAGGAFGGPLAADRAFYFVNTEVTRERQDAVLTSPLAAGLAPTAFDQHAGVGRLDVRSGATGSFTLRYLFADYTHDRDVGFIGGLALPSAGLVVDYRNDFASVDHRRPLGSGALEIGAMIGRLRSNWHTPDPGPRVTVTDRGALLAVIGGVSDDFSWTETDVQARAAYMWLKGRHTVKAGADLLRGAFDIQSGPGARGAYVIDLDGRPISPAGPYLSVADLPTDTRVVSYSQTFVNPRVQAAQTFVSAFAEDIIRAHPDVTVTLGARWDYDSITNTPVGSPDLDNIAPRLGLTWAPRGSLRDRIRAGVGVFYERIPFAVYSDTVFSNPGGGALGVTFAPGTPFTPPVFPHAFDRSQYEHVPLGALPPRNVQVFDPELRSPWTRQISVGYERELPGNVSIAADYVNARGANLIRRVDANAPASIPAGSVRSVAEADASRPTIPAAGGLRLVERDESTGSSQFHGLYLSAKKRLSGRTSLDVSWTISRTENNTDDINFRPADSRQPEEEWGPSLNDRLHVVALSGTARLPWGLDVTPVLFISSGQPLNVTTGNDENGDTIFNDRPARYARNSERTTGYRQLDVGFARRVRIGRTDATLRMDVFNIFNTVNYSGFFNFGASGVRPDEAGTLAFQPTVAGPPRQFQLSVRAMF